MFKARGRRGRLLTNDGLPDVLRERWAGVLCRDAAQLEAVRSADEVPLLDDLRRAPEFRGHTGRPTKTTRRSEFRRRRAEEESS